MKKTNAKIGLYLTEKRDGNFFHLSATVVTVGLNPSEMASIDSGSGYVSSTVNSDTIRNANDDQLNGLYLNNFTVHSQGNNDDTARHLYGFEVRYMNVYAIDCRQAQMMAKTLTTIENRMDKVYQKFGHAATFGQYLARVADAIGATSIVVATSNRGWSYAENSHRIMSIADGVYHADHMARKWATPETSSTAKGWTAEDDAAYNNA